MLQVASASEEELTVDSMVSASAQGRSTDSRPATSTQTLHSGGRGKGGEFCVQG